MGYYKRCLVSKCSVDDPNFKTKERKNLNLTIHGCNHLWLVLVKDSYLSQRKTIVTAPDIIVVYEILDLNFDLIASVIIMRMEPRESSSPNLKKF